MRILRKAVLSLLFALAFTSLSGAGSITPEAKKFLDDLRAPLRGIESLSWEMVNPAMKGRYRKGGFIRLDQVSSGWAMVITPDGVSSYRPYDGLLTRGWAGVRDQTALHLWFYLPLLPDRVLDDMGKITVRSGPFAGKQYRILTIDTLIPTPRDTASRRHQFYFDGTRLARYVFSPHRGSLLSGMRDRRFFSAVRHEQIGGCNWAVAILDRISCPQAEIRIRDLKLNPALDEKAFELTARDALIVGPAMTEEQIKARLAQETDPQRKASLHLALGRLREWEDPAEYAASIEQYRKAVELYPAARAGHLALVRALRYNSQQQDALKVCEGMLGQFSGHMVLIYMDLARLYRSEPTKDLEALLHNARRWLQESPNAYRPPCELAYALTLNGKREEAAKLYEAAIASPDTTDGVKARYHLWLARQYVQLGRPADAEKELLAIAAATDRVSSRAVRSTAERDLGKLYKKHGGLDEALARELAAHKARPEDIPTLWRLLVLHRVKGNRRETGQVAEKIVSLRPDLLPLCQSRLPRQQQTREERCASFDRCFESFPELIPQYVAPAVRAYRETGRADTAEQLIQRCVQEHPDDPYVLYILAYLRQESDRLTDAIDLYERAVAAASPPHHKDTCRLSLAHVYRRANKHEEAKRILKQIVEAGTKHDRDIASRALMDLLKEMGEASEYVKKAEDVAAEAPRDEDKLSRLAGLLTAKHDHAGAAAVCEKIVKLRPSQENYEQWIRALSQARDFEKKTHALEQMLQRFPYLRPSRASELLIACQNAGQLDKCLRLAGEYAETYADDGYVLGQVAESYLALERYAQAVSTYTRAIELSKEERDRYRYRLSLARAYEAIGKSKDAQDTLREAAKAATTDREREEAARLLAESLARPRWLPDLIQELEAKVAANPRNEGAMYRLAVSHLDAGHCLRAADLYRALIELRPSEDRYYGWALALSRTEQYRAFLAAYEEYLKKYPTAHPPADHERLVRAYERTGQIDRAVSIYRTRIRATPMDLVARLALADLLSRAGRSKEAIEEYNEYCGRMSDLNLRFEAQKKIVAVYRQQGQSQEALSVALNMIQTAPTEAKRREANLLYAAIMKELDEK